MPFSRGEERLLFVPSIAFTAFKLDNPQLAMGDLEFVGHILALDSEWCMRALNVFY